MYKVLLITAPLKIDKEERKIKLKIIDSFDYFERSSEEISPLQEC